MRLVLPAFPKLLAWTPSRPAWPWMVLGLTLVSALVAAGVWWAGAPAKALQLPPALPLADARPRAPADGEELWAFLDGDGKARFADHQVDARYERLSVGGGEVDPVAGKRDHPRSLALSLEISPKALAVRNRVREASRAYGVPAELLMAMMAVESGFENGRVSPRGAVGLMQILPDVALEHALPHERDWDWRERLQDPRWNIDMGARILARLQQRFGRVDLVVAAWNAGAGRVRRAGGVPQIDETQAHVLMVLELYWAQLQRGHRSPGAGAMP